MDLKWRPMMAYRLSLFGKNNMCDFCMLLKALASELIRGPSQKRGPLPIELLGVDGIALAKAQGGAIDGPTAASYLYQSARISRVIQGKKLCLDFGCGTGVQLLQVAQLNPEIQFIAIDCEQTLIDRGQENAKKMGLSNIEWLCDDVTRLARLDDLVKKFKMKVDAVISTMTLHGLRDLKALNDCFHQIEELVGNEGAIYIEDFSRLRSSQSIDFFVKRLGLLPQDRHFFDLIKAGMHSAFTFEELVQTTKILKKTKAYSTYPFRLLTIIKTPDRSLNLSTRDKLLKLKYSLSRRAQGELKVLHFSLTLGGVKGDPFCTKKTLDVIRNFLKTNRCR